MELQNILQDLKIRPIKKTTRFYSIKKVDQENISFIHAFIYDKYDDIYENIGILYALNEADLKRDLLNIYGVHHLSERKFENFVPWFTKISGAIPLEKTELILEKFN